MKQPDSLRDIAKNPGQPLAHIDTLDQVPLPPPFDKLDEEPPFAQLTDEAREKYVVLDDTIAVNIPDLFPSRSTFNLLLPGDRSIWIIKYFKVH